MKNKTSQNPSRSIPPASPLANQVAFNSLFSSITKISGTVLSIIALGIVNRALGTEGVGKYNTILTLFYMLTAFGDLGLNAITAREISKAKSIKEEKTIISTVIGLRFITSTLLVLAALLMYFLLNYDENIRKGILIISLGTYFALTYQVLTGIFQKRLTAYKVSIAEFFGRIVNLSWIIVCWKYNLSLLWVLQGMMLSWFTIFVIVLSLSRRVIKFNFKIDLDKSKKLLKLSLPIGLSTVITFLYFRADTLVLSWLKDMHAVGIHSAAYKIVENLTYFPAMFMGLILPLLSKYIYREKVKFKKIANRAFDAISIVSMGILFGILALASEIIAIIAGNEFTSSILPLKLLSVAILGIFFGQYFNMVLIAANQQRKLLKIFIIAAVFNLTSNFIFIPHYSYLATATISSLTEILVALLGSILLYKNTKYLPSFKAFFKSLLAGLIMFFELMILSKFLPPADSKLIFLAFTGFKILTGGLTYLIIVYALKAFNKKDFESILPKRLKKL
ncbi:MAG: oligosaccharide flippase family protein [Candidatus Moranbacteria bacterium]|nr:oligosaccharide flippase family protein [Candidatus Moranbacteria bacterium]